MVVLLIVFSALWLVALVAALCEEWRWEQIKKELAPDRTISADFIVFDIMYEAGIDVATMHRWLREARRFVGHIQETLNKNMEV